MRPWKNVKSDPAPEEKLESILRPDPQAKGFKVTIEFGYKISPKYKEAVDRARRMPSYFEKGKGEWVRHSATFTPEDVEELFELFKLVHDWETTEVLVNHKRLPYAFQLWLPLMWFYRIK